MLLLRTSSRLIVLPLLAAACFSSKGKGGGEPGSPDGSSTSTAGGPSFLALGTDGTTVTQWQPITFSAVVTDPDGLADIAGGVLKDANGAVYGPFVASGTPGTYSCVLTWSSLNSVDVLTFARSTQRTVIADFYDAAGHEATHTVTVSITCPDQDAKLGYADSGSCRLKCSTSASAPFCEDPDATCCGADCSYRNTVDHCQTCDACPPAPAHAQATCQFGECTYFCDSGYQTCNGACVQLHSDDACINCGDACVDGNTCQESNLWSDAWACCPPQSCLAYGNDSPLACYPPGACYYLGAYFTCALDGTGQATWQAASASDCP